MISHVYPNGTKRPIAFASRTLSMAEQNYAQLEKEGLGLVFGVNVFILICSEGLSHWLQIIDP